MTKISFWAAVLPALFCAAASADDLVKAYVLNEGSATVSIVESQTEKVGLTFKVGERPRGLAVSPEGERLYVGPERRHARRARPVRKGGQRARDARRRSVFDRYEP
jgi:YVTN family beta-propeller protein